jgi:serine protease Do
MTSDLDGALAALAERVRVSTVCVHDPRGRASGSGIIWPHDDLVITNAHVARGSDAIVETQDGRRLRAVVVRYDRSRDLAALRVEGGALGLRPALLRDAAELRPGELVFAVGNPLGLTGAVSAGLVQRCNGRWVVADVRLAPGNSGGPLADATGRVVGINSLIARGFALAVPSGAVADFLGRPVVQA